MEKEYFQKLDSKKLYIRFFDVDADESVISPKAKIKVSNIGSFSPEYVPVVFITSHTFSKMSESDLDNMASNINKLIEVIRLENGFSEIREIQIDCDWTQSIKDTYFRFLKNMRDVSKKDISCTLRLHQIKFKEKTGIPPVSKGYLMSYATSNPTETSSQINSILDMSLLKDYTNNINDYPLDFDIALPLYSWAIVRNHLGRIKLINNLNIDDIDPALLKVTGVDTYEIQDDFFLDGIYLNKGFNIKIESITPALLQEAKQYLDQKITKDYNIVYYHLDKAFLEHFTIDNLK